MKYKTFRPSIEIRKFNIALLEHNKICHVFGRWCFHSPDFDSSVEYELLINLLVYLCCRHVTFLCGRGGVYALGAVVANYMGDHPKRDLFLGLFNEVL